MSKPIYILSLSGGGVRGTIIAQFLKRLEENMDMSILDKFDMYGGSSIGSLIVGGIVYSNMTAKTLSDDIFTVDNAKKIMNKSIWDYIFGRIQSKPYYNGIGKKDIINKYINDITIGNTNKKVMITSYDININKPKFFKSWDIEDKDIKLSSIIDSSSAAPCYYPSVRIGDRWYIDGSICANYPTDCIYSDALNIYGKDADIRILCIGTGYPKFKNIGIESEEWGLLQWLTEGDLLEISIDSTERTTNYRMNTFTKALGHKYLRVNDYIDNMSMDDTSKENIDKLKKIGDEWWDIFGNDVLELLNN